VHSALSAKGGTGRSDFESETFVVNLSQITSKVNASNPKPGDPVQTLSGSAPKMGLSGPLGIRRLTPREWERLMGLPDDYTLIPYPKPASKLCSDSPRYRAIGNSMAVPVMYWLGKRIDTVQRIISALYLSGKSTPVPEEPEPWWVAEGGY